MCGLCTAEKVPHLGFLTLAVLLHSATAQLDFAVQFPTINSQLDRPHVECITGLPRDGGACKECTNDDPPLCINSFNIITNEVDPFFGQAVQVRECVRTDISGNEINLHEERFLIVLEAKSPSFNAPTRVVLDTLGNNIECIEGSWTIRYTTTISGQYQLHVQHYQGTGPSGDLYDPLPDFDTNFDSPFEIEATLVMPSFQIPQNFFIDTVLSLRPPCSDANANSVECSYCINPALNGGCLGNDMIPSVRASSRILLQPGDRFFNVVNDFCANRNDFAIELAALSVPEIVPDCVQDSCSSAPLVPRPVPFDVVTTLDCALQPPYTIDFVATYSGFYSMKVSGPATLGPLVIPVSAGAVDPDQTFAYGLGIFGAVQSELATFTIQPMDMFGNHHTSGIHVFQVRIQQVNAAFSTSVEVVDSGRGFVTASYELEGDTVEYSNSIEYMLSIKYCKDLAHYPPYGPEENRLCDLDREPFNYEGLDIRGSPFTISISPSVFDVPGSNRNGLMREFRTAIAGQRYFFLLTMNFEACGQTYGQVDVDKRYRPVVRFDDAAVVYRAYPPIPPPSPILGPMDVSPDDVTNGLLDATQYGEYAERCLDGGYVMTFLITRAGDYRAWLYSDTTADGGGRTVAESPRIFEVQPEERVIENSVATGAGVECRIDTECMANSVTTFAVQMRDKFYNNAISCAEEVIAYLVPQATQDDQNFKIKNLVEEENVGGVSMNGVPGQGIDVNTLSGYVPEAVSGFNATVARCDEGAYRVEIFATLSAQYNVHVLVNNITLSGSPFFLSIRPLTVDLQLGVTSLGLVTYNRWAYYRIYFGVDGIGFNVEVIKTDVNSGQPWTFVRHSTIFADLQEPGETAGIRDEYPHAFSSTYCKNCRVHVPPSDGLLGYWFVAVYGHEDDSYHTVRLTPYPNEVLESSVVQQGSVDPGYYTYYRFQVTSTSGFQVRVTVTGTTQGDVTATLKFGSPPTTDVDMSSIFGQALWQQNCQDCIIDHPPYFLAEGEWHLAILGYLTPVNYQVVFMQYSETTVELGSKPNHLVLPAFAWGYYTFTIDPDIDPDGFKIEVIPSSAEYNVTTVLKRSQHPITLTDSTFRPAPCTHCRLTVMTRTALQATWYIGVYAGATGAEFNLKVKLMKACPNDCFGNGQCVQKKIRACVCFPGYTGIDCRDTVKEKMFAWFPLDENARDLTDNQTPLFYKVNLNGQLRYEHGGLSLQDTYAIVPKPTPAVACASYLTLDPELPEHLQWGEEVSVDQGFGDMRVQATIEEEGRWYRWNQLGDPAGNPRRDKPCAEYNPRREYTFMMRIRMDTVLPSTASFAGMGKPSRVIGRSDTDANGAWSWFLYPVRHSDGQHVVMDLYLRNATHEVSLREQQIYPIDGNPIFEKPDFWLRTFPNKWCIDLPAPVRDDGICEYFELDQWYHLGMVFGPRKAELWIEGNLVANMSLDLWNITDVEHGRIHLGHDPRYAFYERLMFGQIRDVRILRYAATSQEIKSVVANGDSYLNFRLEQVSEEQLAINLGSWENPVPLSSLDDGSLEHDVFPHEEVCRQARNPNEPRDMQQATECPFIDVQTSWLLRETNDRTYRKYDTDRMPYGLGHEELILKDTRPLGDIYLGRFYDFSIDEE